MRKIALVVLLTTISISLQAQIVQEQVQYAKGKMIYQGQLIKRPKEIGSILLQNPAPEIDLYVKKYKNNNGVATAFGFIGGAGVGYSLGSVIGGGKVNAGLLGGGAGAIIIGALFDGVARKNLKMAINSYNSSSLQN